MVAKVDLGHEREFGQVFKLTQIVRVNPLLLAALAVRSNVVISVANRPLQTLELQSCNFVSTGFLDGIKITGLWTLYRHDCLLNGLCCCSMFGLDHVPAL